MYLSSSHIVSSVQCVADHFSHIKYVMSVIPAGPLGISTASKEMAELHNPGELRKMSEGGAHPGIRERLWGLEARLDPTITLEEYVFWAKIEREMEQNEQRVLSNKKSGLLGGIKALGRTSAKEDHSAVAITEKSNGHSSEEDTRLANLSPIAPSATHVYDAEWRQAARALRTTGWGTIFYLITTDILGWSQTPYVFASCGYGLGAGIFVLFGLAAGCSGLMIWRTFLGLDSSRFPMLSFGDPFFRLYGSTARHIVNVGQALQMFCSVAVVLMGNSQILSQLADAKVCYIAIVIINLVIGMASGWLRSLRHLGFLCNFAVWFNIVSFIIICVAAGLRGPDITVANQTTLIKGNGPVMTFIGVPPAEFQQQTTNLFAAQFNGIDTIVYAYSGALLFVAFLAEMRHPMGK